MIDLRMNTVLSKIKNIFRELVKALMFRAVYPFIYNICCLRPLDRRLTLFCEVRHGVLTDSYWTPDDTEEALKGNDAPQEITFDKYIRHNPSDHYPVFVRVKL